ncbi:CHAT domain-containing protein [Mycena vulgaris]|nr:CHAT domain-containing protein [Mycena vulgaris]
MDPVIEANSMSGAVTEFRADGVDTVESISAVPDIPDLQQLVDQIPREDPDLPRYQQVLGMLLINRYREVESLPDVQAAVKNLREAVDRTPKGDPYRAGRLHPLAVALTDRYEMLGDLIDLEGALQAGQEAVELTPVGHPDRASCMQGLGVSFLTQYRRLEDLNDLKAALQANLEAAKATPEGHPQRALSLQNLGACLTYRYQRLGDLNDLEAGLQVEQEAVRLTPKGHPGRAGRLQSVALSFKDRYRRLGDLNDLEAALQAAHEATQLTPEGHPDRTSTLQCLEACLVDRYQRMGNLSDLEAALQANQEALRLTPERHPDRAGHLRNLAVSFVDRYTRLGDLSDLDAALQANQGAVELTPEGDPARAGHLQGLARSFRARYNRLGDLNDLEAALQADKEAVRLTPEGHPGKADQQAVWLTPDRHTAKAERFRELGISFTERYQRLGDLNDLESALQADQEAVELTPEGHPDSPDRLQSLAASFTNRYRKSHRPEDLENIHTNYTLAFKTSSLTPESSWVAALRWASFSEEFQSAHAMTAYYNAFQLLPDILWIGNVLPVRHKATLRLDIGGATSAAARTFINFADFVSAVEVIEQGVGITFQQMLQLKTTLDRIPSAQARELQVLSSELYSGTSSNPQDVAIKRQKLFEDIRKQPDCEHFLLPKSYKELSLSSQGGPVVILNSHQDRCDGIIILDPAADPVHIAFPNVTPALLKSQEETLKQLLGHSNVRAREESASTRLFGRWELFLLKSPEEWFTELLRWLYTNVVAPVYQVLESHGINSGRLWWLPTGAFAGLPLHACPPTNQFIHSYTATLGSLLDACSKKSCTPPKIGLVGVTHTGSGAYRLPGVKQEVKKIKSIIKTSPVECLEGHQATPDTVKLQLQECSWVHLACHGKQDLLEPTKSHLLLYNGVLELDTILHMPLPNAEFVFLAACQTAMGDSRLINESFHLGGGFIAAGFRSAIGTLWSMNDQDGPLVAEKVYSHLFQEGRQPQARDTAEALQLAVEELKAQKVPYERWIPFIHMGI